MEMKAISNDSAEDSAWGQNIQKTNNRMFYISMNGEVGNLSRGEGNQMVGQIDRLQLNAIQR
jgi:succinyl-CoA synthetase beta subunit